MVEKELSLLFLRVHYLTLKIERVKQKYQTAHTAKCGAIELRFENFLGFNKTLFCFCAQKKKFFHN